MHKPNYEYELKFDKKTIERFWLNVDIKSKDECWNWIAAKHKYGYAYLGIKKKQIRINRFSYQLHNGPILNNLHVLHTCDNTLCVNPSHLFLGTNKDNINDKVCKQRQNKKLFDAEVLALLNDYSTGNYTQQGLADKYNICRPMITMILSKKRRVNVDVNITKINKSLKIKGKELDNIKKLYYSGVTQAIIAKQYGVSQANISKIITGKRVLSVT